MKYILITNRCIIAGRGNNTFDPSANVTGVEAAKMLLTALGYDANIEGLVGSDWALNTAALAQNLGIFRNFTKDVSAPLNRDDAALLIYNALDVELIQEYRNGYAISYDDHRTILSSVFGVMRVEGVVVANEWAQLQETDSSAALREGRTTLDNVVVYDSTTSNTVVPEGVREDDPVTFNVATPVEYMGKAVTLYVEKTTILSNSVVIGVATNDDMNVINFTADGQDTVTDYLKGTGVAVDDNTEYYVNYGHMSNADAAIDWVNEYYYSEQQGNDFSLNGIEVQVIDNDDDGLAEYVLYLQETLSEVARYNERNETVSFYTPDRSGTVNLKVPSSSDDAVTTVTEDMADVVLAADVSLEGVETSDSVDLESSALILYVQYGGRTYIKNPDVVTGKMTRIDRDRNNEQYITVDNGETYYQSYILDAASMVDVDVTRFLIDVAESEVGFDTTYDFILDSNGYIVAFRPAEDVVTNYALVLDSAWTQNALEKAGQVKILMANGTTNTYYIDWDESAKAFANITDIHGAVSGSNSSKLETYLGSRDVQQGNMDLNGDGVVTDGEREQYYAIYRTGRAAGSVIEYSLNEAGDELTIERVLQGNTFESTPATSIEINSDWKTTSPTSASTTAGVSDNGVVIFLDGIPTDHDNLQYVDVNGYDNGYGTIRVRGVEGGHTGTKDYAVDQNTVAFYYYWDASKGDNGEFVYGTATGWSNMSDVDAGTDVQVYPVLSKETNRTYKASNLADVILFEAKPNTVAEDYMLVLSRNAIGKDLLELNVVFEDGTAATVTIDDEGDIFKREDPECYMQAWTYSENADGTYDIGTPAEYYGQADLLQVGTIDLNNGQNYLALPSSANVWDVTDVKTSSDTVDTGRFQENVYVNTVAIVSEGQVRTAWIWDLDDDQTPTGGYNFNWDSTGFQTVYPYLGWSQYQIQQYLLDGDNVRVVGNLTLSGDLYIPAGTILQVEGTLTDRDANGNIYNISGGGTLRVRDDFNLYNSSLTVNTQVGDMAGDDLNLRAAATTISSRVGVYGDIIGTDLTVSSTGNVYVVNDVTVPTLHVDGHLSANNVEIHNGQVHSSNTLIVRGNLTFTGNGTLTIGGTCSNGLTSTAGRVEVYGAITDGIYTGNVNIINGVLSLSRTASMNLAGGVSIAYGSQFTQTSGSWQTLTAGSFTINGTLSAPSSTIDSANIHVGNTGRLTALAATSTPTVDAGGVSNVGEITTEPTTGGWLTRVTVLGEAVDLNHDSLNGSLVLTQAYVENTTGSIVVAAAEGYNVAEIRVNNAIVGNNSNVSLHTGANTITVLVTDANSASRTYNITVTVSASYSVTLYDGQDKDNNVTGITVTDAQMVDDTAYVVANDAATFKVTLEDGYSIDSITYTMGGRTQGTPSGNNTNGYTIPSVTGDVVVTVKTIETPVDASLSVEEKTVSDTVFEMVKDPTGKNVTIYVPHDYKITADSVAKLVTVKDGTDEVTIEVGTNATFENNTMTINVDGQHGGNQDKVTIKLENVSETDARTRNVKAIEDALADLGAKGVSCTGLGEESAENAVKSEIAKLEIKDWSKNGQNIDLSNATVSFPSDWNPPIDNATRTDTFDVEITFADDDAPTSFTITVKIAYSAS